MYGKFFASTFTGSMCGAGPAVFAVWGYVIANAVDSQVELNPRLLASVIGAPEPAIVQAITELCEPDPESRNPTDEGRRLQREGQFQYRVTSHSIYRAIRNNDDLREYNRKKQQEFRKKRQTVSNTVKLNVIDSQEMSRHTEAEAEADTKAKREKSEKASLSPAALPNPNGNGKMNDGVPGKYDPFIDRAVTTRAAAFIERYRTQLYPTHRHGAKYSSREHRDYDAAVRLCETWTDDARLDKLAICFLTTDHKFAEEGSRTIPQFRALASWLDGELSKWEAARNNP